MMLENTAQHKAETQEKPRLGNALRQRHVTMISLGGIIGAGLFVGSSAAIANIGPAATVTYALAGLIVLLVMRMIGEMAVALPDVGTFTEYVRTSLGNLSGFTAGWLYWYFFVIVVAVEAVAGAELLQRWIPVPMWALALALVITMTAVNLIAVKSYGETEFWFASIKVGAIIVFMAVAASYALGWTSGTGPTTVNLVNDGGFMPNGLTAVLAGIPTVIFAICGAEIATIAAAESSEPARSVAKMTRSVIARVLTFYVGSVFLIVCVVPWREIVPGTSPFVAVLDRMHIPASGEMMNIIVVVAVLSCLNSAVYVSSRVLFSLSTHGDAPRSFSRLSHTRVPTRAVLAGGAVGYVAIGAAVFSPDGLFAFLVNASGAIMLLIYLLVGFAQLRLRRRMQREGRELSLKMWLFPWLTIAVILSIVVVLGMMAAQPGLSGQFFTSLASVAVVLAGYVVRKKVLQNRSGASPM
ncbi:amino acid permease [Saccharopolyspora pogona]|uniref:amino acid permease n=1 Tax=Saccharopolyspora pogona TaxID=333966 RepID=UPI001CC25C17|nr:amino acid permease [Saccharopolyspora pogona]